jgi:Holliday junction resolvasome RuvABC DNA-binding subunit
LAGKLALPDGVAGRRAPGSAGPVRTEVSAALVALGWSATQAEDALDEVLGGEAPPSSVPDVLKAALRTMAARRG